MMEPEDKIVLESQRLRKPTYDPTGKIESIAPQESRIFDIRRHYIGLIIIYLQISIALLLALGLIGVFLPGLLTTIKLGPALVTTIFAMFSFGLVLLTVVFLFLMQRIYTSNQLILTYDNITQVHQIGLFHRKVSELSLVSVEDVTSRQKGILQTIFNYGSITIETAGEQDNYVFDYCANPNAVAKMILDARSVFIDQKSQTTNRR